MVEMVGKIAFCGVSFVDDGCLAFFRDFNHSCICNATELVCYCEIVWE